MAKGGRRAGSGRKPKDAILRALDGGARHEAQPYQIVKSLTATAPVAVACPVELSEAEEAVWLRQAPLALRARTLTEATALSFARYCRLVVLEAGLWQTPDVGGTNHRGILQRINALELQFLLTPMGKPVLDVPVEEKPVNPLDRFIKRGSA